MIEKLLGIAIALGGLLLAAMPHLLPGHPALAVGVGMVLAGVGIALGALSAPLATLEWRTRLWNAARVFLVAVGVALALGLLTPAKPSVPPLRLEVETPRGSFEVLGETLPFSRTVDLRGGARVTLSAPEIRWRSDVEAALGEARAAGRPAILDAGAQWCAACKELEHVTFTAPEVIAALQGHVAIRVDMTRFDEEQARLMALDIDIQSLPWVGFFLPDGRLNPGATLRDFEAPGAFVQRVQDAAIWRDRPLSVVERWIDEYGLLVALALVFVAGIGVSLTPCVYPMIPITLGVVGAANRGDGPGIPFGRRALRSAVFVLGLVLVYAALGVVSALLGKGFGSWLQHPAVTVGMAVLFAALAFSYLGFFRLDLPAEWKARMSRQRGGLSGVALAGGVAGVVAAPCAGPVIVGILAIVSGTGNLPLGVVLMLTFGLGLGLLFFVLGLSTAALAHRARPGQWMERVEVAFALALLLVAFHYGRLGLLGA